MPQIELNTFSLMKQLFDLQMLGGIDSLEQDDGSNQMGGDSSPKPEDLSLGGNEIRVKSEMTFPQMGMEDNETMDSSSGDGPMSSLAIVHDETIDGPSSAMLARLNAAAAEGHQDQDVDVDVVGEDQDVDVDGDIHDDSGLKMITSGLDSDMSAQGSGHQEERRRLFRSAHLNATPSAYSGAGRRERDKNGNISGGSGRLSTSGSSGRNKRPFSISASATSSPLNNNTVSNNNNHEKSPPLPPKRTRSVTNAMANQNSHSNSTSPSGGSDVKLEKVGSNSGSPNSSVSLLNACKIYEDFIAPLYTNWKLNYRLVQKSQIPEQKHHISRLFLSLEF